MTIITLDSSRLGFSKGFSLSRALQSSAWLDQDDRIVGPVDAGSTGRVWLHLEVQQISLRRNQDREHSSRLRHSRSWSRGRSFLTDWREDDLQKIDNYQNSEWIIKQFVKYFFSKSIIFLIMKLLKRNFY